MRNKLKKSTVIPLCLLLYLCVMAWVSRDRIAKGDTLYYCGVLVVSLVIIVTLHFVLKKQERLRREREEQQYGTYADDDKGRTAP